MSEGAPFFPIVSGRSGIAPLGPILARHLRTRIASETNLYRGPPPSRIVGGGRLADKIMPEAGR